MIMRKKMKFRKQEAVTSEFSPDFEIVCTKCDRVIDSLYNRNAGEMASHITGERINKILREHKCKEKDGNNDRN